MPVLLVVDKTACIVRAYGLCTFCFSNLELHLYSSKTAVESSAGATLSAAIATASATASATAIALFCMLLLLLLLETLLPVLSCKFEQLAHCWKSIICHAVALPHSAAATLSLIQHQRGSKASNVAQDLRRGSFQ
jgi:hypothetical protein